MDNHEPYTNWSETVEDLVAAGDTEAAISLLETAISNLETTTASSHGVSATSDLQLASALTELANLYSSKHFSLKADELNSRATVVKLRALQSNPSLDKEEKFRRLKGSDSKSIDDSSCSRSVLDGKAEKPSNLLHEASDDDDWETIADREPHELLTSECAETVSNVSSEDTKVQTTKRRGRGRFSYKSDESYSDQQSDIYNIAEEDSCKSKEQDAEPEPHVSKYGTRHVLVLANLSPSTRTIDLEKLFEDFKDRGVIIRWINDTTALAVFRTPAIALEALNCNQFSFNVRILEEDDVLMDSIPRRDLEPPRQRPKTSARAAQRLIAQGMGLKLPSTFGSQELKKQEEARKNRIVTRQKLRDDAWGDD